MAPIDSQFAASTHSNRLLASDAAGDESVGEQGDGQLPEDDDLAENMF